MGKDHFPSHKGRKLDGKPFIPKKIKIVFICFCHRLNPYPTPARHPVIEKWHRWKNGFQHRRI